MTHQESIAVAIICDRQTQLASVAPFLDLAKISEQSARQFDDGDTCPHIEIDLLTLEKSFAASMLWQARLLNNDQRTYDAVVVPANDDMIDIGRQVPRALKDWLRNQHERGAVLAGIGSGPLALIEAGLLDGSPVTVSPRYEKRVRKSNPSTRLAHGCSIVEHERIITAAEGSFSAAVAVILAGRLHSNGLAERYRRIFGLGENAISGTVGLPRRANLDLLVAEARAVIVARTHEQITTDDLAAHFNMNKRTLIRRFERSTGMTPSKFIRAARIDAAAAMLSRTRLSVEEIGCAVGYQDAASFRLAFKEATGYSPREFRMERALGTERVERGISMLSSVKTDTTMQAVDGDHEALMQVVDDA